MAQELGVQDAEEPLQGKMAIVLTPRGQVSQGETKLLRGSATVHHIPAPGTDSPPEFEPEECETVSFLLAESRETEDSGLVGSQFQSKFSHSGV